MRRRYLAALAALAVLPVSSVPAAIAGTTDVESSASYVELKTESFDSLSSQLKPAVDENIPADVLGWTHVPPVGWEVQNSSTMPAGMTEWQGWSFTTPRFWTAADTQGRESFGLGSGVIAVADPDEWDDKGSPAGKGRFDSSLLTPTVPLPTGTRVLKVAFDNHYLQYADQTAQVLASFDGAAPVEVLRYGAGSADVVNQRTEATVVAPDGASNVRLTFRMSNAGNDWYWAIDDVTVSARSAGEFPAVVEPTGMPAVPAGVSNRKVLVVGADGLRADQVKTMPSLATLGTVSETPLYGPPLSDPTAESGWASLASGTWPDAHRVTGSDVGLGELASHPDFLTRLEAANPQYSTVVLADRPTVTLARSGEVPVFAKADTRLTWDGPRHGYASRDAAVATAAEQVLRNSNPDAVVVQLGQLEQGGDAASLKTVDALIGRLADAVRARDGKSSERWQVLVVSTTAGTARNGVLVSRGLKPSVPPDLVDIAPTVLGALGVGAPADLAGRDLAKPSSDPFDQPTLPKGWTITGRPAGGDTAWQGWVPTTRAAWSAHGADLERANATRLNGRFLVADRQRWGGTGTFTSEIRSPAFRVNGSTATIRFVTALRWAPGQLARMTVSLNGGPSIEIASYGGSKPATAEAIQVPLPPGTRTLAVRWQLYDAQGDTYWAIDAPSVTSS